MTLQQSQRTHASPATAPEELDDQAKARCGMGRARQGEAGGSCSLLAMRRGVKNCGL